MVNYVAKSDSAFHCLRTRSRPCHPFTRLQSSNAKCPSVSSQHILHHMPMHVGQAKAAALELEGELFVVDAQKLYELAHHLLGPKVPKPQALVEAPRESQFAVRRVHHLPDPAGKAIRLLASPSRSADVDAVL
jgi:hypothetical protein